VTAVGDQQRDALGGIDRRAAADPDYHRDIQIARDVGPLQAVHVARVALHVVKQRGAQAGRTQASQHRLAQPGLVHARIGDHEYVAVAEGSSLIARLGDDAPAELGARRHLERA
jgi:hypothetical protein